VITSWITFCDASLFLRVVRWRLGPYCTKQYANLWYLCIGTL
jgi:hypothetical protein